jgi:hypothetical protein
MEFENKLYSIQKKQDPRTQDELFNILQNNKICIKGNGFDLRTWQY